MNVKRTWPALAAIAALVLAVAASALAGTATPQRSGSSSSGVKVAYLVDGLDIPYWDYVYQGAKQVGKSLGLDVVAYDFHHDPAQQVAQTKIAISQGVKGIILSPNSSASAPATLKLAAAAKIPVVFAFIGADSGTYASLITSADYQQGIAVGNYMKKLLGGSGEVVCACLDLTRANARLKMSGFKKAIAGSGVKLVQVEQAKDYSIGESSGFVRNMLTAHPSVRGIFSMFDNSTLGAVAGVKALGKKPGTDVKIVGLDGSPQTLADVKKGLVNAMSVQQAIGGGKAAARTLAKVLKGQKVPRQVNLSEPLVTKANYTKMIGWVQSNVFPRNAK
jgi:ABC-type sugar transport system substrate-binding protein